MQPLAQLILAKRVLLSGGAGGSKSEDKEQTQRRAKTWSGAAEAARQHFCHARYCAVTVARRFITSNQRPPSADHREQER
jgi:hypothetical protein